MAFLVKDKDQRSTIRALEGGNLFQATNMEGKRFHFIGRNALLFEIDIKNIKHGVISNPSNLTQKEIHAMCDEELERYKKIFASNNVVVLPQWTYHLDLQMTYIGKSTFIVHSFKEVLNNLEKLSEQERYRREFQLGAEDAMPREIIIMYIIAILKACGFKVIPSASVLYCSFMDPRDKPMNLYSMGKEVHSSLVNGIDLYNPLNQKFFFLTADSPFEEHKRYFSGFLKDQGIEPVFLRTNGASAEETMKYIVQTAGALRCQTNFIPDQMLAHSYL
ncbi:MAG: hypothetical protein GY750_07750 [Lentisphaerae bacterium]|nr:hypothetical protein [Lentisphaerota bacterium]